MGDDVVERAESGREFRDVAFEDRGVGKADLGDRLLAAGDGGRGEVDAYEAGLWEGLGHRDKVEAVAAAEFEVTRAFEGRYSRRVRPVACALDTANHCVRPCASPEPVRDRAGVRTHGYTEKGAAPHLRDVARRWRPAHNPTTSRGAYG